MSERLADAPTSESAGFALDRVSVPKASDVLADQLRLRIRAGELGEGQGLPTERELVLQSGLSRASVREALRILEVEGLIEIRAGRAGGSKVRRPAGAELSRSLDLFIWGQNVGLEELHEVREALETVAADGAARRRTEADLTLLRSQTIAVETSVDDMQAYLAANLAWHLAIARASHNELLIRFMNVLSNAIHEETALDAFDSPQVRSSTLKIHRGILNAIIAGDADAARRRMARHVAAAGKLAIAAAKK
jgi:GntR family transcriptional regulator, transcriptional repressor for pyruvate dehydrogenase complex